MKRLVLSPYSSKVANPLGNPKNYPRFQDVVTILKNTGIWHITQIGTATETAFTNVDAMMTNATLDQIEQLIETCDVWLAVDNFLHHMLRNNSKGVVVWGQSDPNLFGYGNHVNLLKSRSYLRENQFGTWDECQYRTDCWVGPDEVASAVIQLAG